MESIMRSASLALVAVLSLLALTDGCDGGGEDGPREPVVYTVAECEAAGGVAVADPGDGSITSGGCPNQKPALGVIDGVSAGWDEGGLCCEILVTDCAPQRVMFIGTCEPAPRFYWVGTYCVGLTGCSCEGDDCDAGFASQMACEAAYVGCQLVTTDCGGFAGNTCEANEYCTYEPSQMCGGTDGSSICQPRPEVCDLSYDPVCGCDGMTYSNACVANAAGAGLYAYAACE